VKLEEKSIADMLRIAERRMHILDMHHHIYAQSRKVAVSVQ